MPASLCKPETLTHPFKGRHVMAELSAGFKVLNDKQAVANALKRAIPKGGATLLNIQTQSFEPYGVTSLALLAESHASIHTYPEIGRAFLDVFTCGSCQPEVIAHEIALGLGAKLENTRTLERSNERGVVEEIAAGLHREWRVEDVIVEAQTPFQHMLIGRTAQGLSLFCNNERQSTELSQKIYHEGQIVPAALMTEKIDRVLVIGSSEGVVSQMAVALGASKVVHVDIDETCVRLCAKHLPYGYMPNDVDRALRAEGPIRLLFEDGYQFVKNCVAHGEKFDIVVMDLPDEQLTEAQQNRLYESDFLEDISQLLTPGGAFINQAGSTTYWRNETLIRSVRRMRSKFKSTVFFEMEEQDWAWLVGCNFECGKPAQRMIERLSTLKMRPAFIDEQSIQKATILPVSIRKLLEREV